MCVQIFHLVNIDVTAGVGAPPLDTQLRLQIARYDFSCHEYVGMPTHN